MFQAYKQLNDLDRAKENLTLAIKYSPEDRSLRAEYKQLCDLKGAKEKEWQSKMAGFYNGPKLQRIEENDKQETLLREKIKRQTF